MSRNSSSYYMYIREQSNTIVLLLNIWNQGTWNRFILQLKCFLDLTIVFDSDYKHFYTNMCSQSSESQFFPLPEKEDSEQQSEGIELVLRILDCAKDPSLQKYLQLGSSKSSWEPTDGPQFASLKRFFLLFKLYKLHDRVTSFPYVHVKWVFIWL